VHLQIESLTMLLSLVRSFNISSVSAENSPYFSLFCPL